MLLPAAAEPERRILRSLQEVNALTPAEARKGFPIRAVAELTMLSMETNVGFLQNGSAAVYFFPPASGWNHVREGQWVEFEGVTEPGGYSPIIGKIRLIRVLDRPPQPPVQLTLAEAQNYPHENVKVEVRGTITRILLTGNYYHRARTVALRVTDSRMPGVELPVRLDEPYHAGMERWLDCEAEFSGILGTEGTGGGHRLRALLVVDDPEEVRIGACRTAPLSAARARIGDLLRYKSPHQQGARVRVRGLVTYVDREGWLIVQDGDAGTRVQPRSPRQAKVGETVEIEGVAKLRDGRLWLDEAAVRVIPEAIRVTPVDARAIAVDLTDATLVAVRGKASLPRRVDGFDYFELEEDGHAYRVQYPADDRSSPPLAVTPGAVYEVHGVLLYRAGAVGETISLDILLRSPADVVLLANVPWTERVPWLTVAGVMLACVAGGALWIVQLRRAVTERTRQLMTAKIEADAASQAKSTFLANMSHEIRTPLNGVLGLTQCLLESPLNGEQRGWSQTILRSGEQLLALLNDVLDMAKIEAGRLELHPRRFSPAELLRQVRDLFAPRGGSLSLPVHLVEATDLPDWVEGDDLRIRQIVSNFVSNAVKFTQSGSVTIIGEWVAGGEDRGRFRVTVEDTGPGMSPEQQARLFQRFRQGDEGLTRRADGTGLGLALSAELAVLLGGSVGCQSTAGRGSRFFLEVPLRLSTAPVVAPEREESFHAAELRVLVVEDNPVNQLVVRAMLRRLEVEPVIAGSGEEALREAGTQDFDLILMDLHMPGIDGIETTRRLRDGRNGATPIIALTANVLPTTRAACEEAGMVGFLSKPLERRELSALLESIRDRQPRLVP